MAPFQFIFVKSSDAGYQEYGGSLFCHNLLSSFTIVTSELNALGAQQFSASIFLITLEHVSVIQFGFLPSFENTVIPSSVCLYAQPAKWIYKRGLALTDEHVVKNMLTHLRKLVATDQSTSATRAR